MGNIQDNNQTEFLDLLPEIVFEIDSDLNIKFLNQSCERVLGYKRDELLNKKMDLEQIVIPEHIDRIKENIEKNFNGIQTSGNSYNIYSKKGEIFTLEFYNSHVKQNNKIVGLRCIAIDVTKKERIHKELKTQEKHYRQIFQNSPIPYQSLDENAIIIDINPSWEKIMGYSKKEVIGKPFTLVVPKEKHKIFSERFQKFLKTGEIINFQFELNHKKGSIIYINFNGKVEYSDTKEVVKTHCVFNDITLQRIAEQTLMKSELKFRELNATKDKFFSIIAHDLKNPFNDLMGFTQLLALNIEKYDKPKIEQFVNIIHQSSKLAYNLLENLLDWSRAQTGMLKFKPEKILINNLINETIELLESTARNKNIEIYSELNFDLYAFADKNMVRTIIRNLISNAIKYTNQGGIIKIQSFCSKHYCEIGVSDNGIGISETNVNKLFKIDESYSTIGTEREKGTGLGLILCKEFVEKNKGELRVKSKPDKGSIFSFTLPLPEPEFKN